MDKKVMVDYLCELNNVDATDNGRLCPDRLQGICEKFNCNFESISENLSSITSLYLSNDTPVEWKYICLSFYILKLINDNLQSNDDILSVQQAKELKKCVHNLVRVGICTRLLPKLPFYVKKEEDVIEDVLVTYNILKCTTFGLSEFLKLVHVRPLILPENLKGILVSIYQLVYCPLKKPVPGEAVMTEQVYLKVVEEREIFSKLLLQLRDTIHPSIYVKETMAILHSSAPIWFKKAVAQNLTSILRSKRGVEKIVSTLLDGTTNDTTQTWQILEVCSKLILSCKDFPDFEENMCKQIISLVYQANSPLIYERMFVHCTKIFYGMDKNRARNLFIEPSIDFFVRFTSTGSMFSAGQDISGEVIQNIRIIRAMFLENSSGLPRLSVNLLKPIVYVLFRFYALVFGTTLKSTADDLKGLLLVILNNWSGITIFDSFLFGMESTDVLSFRNDLTLTVENNNIFVALSEHTVTYSPAENCDCLKDLIKSKDELKLKLFGFLLSCICNKDKYFKKASDELLSLEHKMMNEYIERSLVVYKLLAELAADKSVQSEIAEKPDTVIEYIKNVIDSAPNHKLDYIESEEFQSTFTVLMILQSLINNTTHLKAFKIFTAPLIKMKEGLSDAETKKIVEDILGVLDGDKKANQNGSDGVKTELDIILEDLCDPLLPVRGHALMQITKLVEQKDDSAMERRQYILNIFQQHLKEEDSYIYLSAIRGLTAMADAFTDTVLNVLCEEYSDFSRREKTDGQEIRMKLGECLMRTIKLLGDMAPKYKPLLLNTILLGAKDDDDLIRASALSNLGEICRVLGFKLGSIVTDVLVCVHAVIATDNSPQARRSAVAVLRQLFVGLEVETIHFLKDDILPIYRTLKAIYDDDKDDIMRLQAQLALEELNENVRAFVFPRPNLSEKKIFVLD